MDRASWYNDSKMSNQTPTYKQRCPAMIEAGVEDPDSIEGKLFCAGSRDDSIKSQCPYSVCIVFEGDKAKQLKTNIRARLAKELHRHNVSLDDIALILYTDRETIRRYLKR